MPPPLPCTSCPGENGSNPEPEPLTELPKMSPLSIFLRPMRSVSSPACHNQESLSSASANSGPESRDQTVRQKKEEWGGGHGSRKRGVKDSAGGKEGLCRGSAFKLQPRKEKKMRKPAGRQFSSTEMPGICGASGSIPSTREI